MSTNKHEKLRRRLLDSHQAVLDRIEALDEVIVTATPANAAWSVKDLVAHLAASELGHCHVIRRLLAGDSTLIPDFDLDTFNNTEVEARRTLSWPELVAEYKANRMATLALLENVRDTDWDIGGAHPGGFDTTVEGVFRVIAIHERRHLRELNTVLKKV